MEPWRAGLEWKTMSIGDHLATGGSNGKRSKRTTVSLESSDAINFNLTSTLVELYQMVKANWTEDYYNFGGQQQTTVASRQGGEEYLTGRSSVTYRYVAFLSQFLHTNPKIRPVFTSAKR